jgi:hypothetical protein
MKKCDAEVMAVSLWMWIWKLPKRRVWQLVLRGKHLRSCSFQIALNERGDVFGWLRLELREE